MQLEEFIRSLSAVWYLVDTTNDDKTVCVTRRNVLPLIAQWPHPDDGKALWALISDEAGAFPVDEIYGGTSLAADALHKAYQHAEDDCLQPGQINAEALVNLGSTNSTVTECQFICFAQQVLAAMGSTITDSPAAQHYFEQAFAQYETVWHAASAFNATQPSALRPFRVTVRESDEQENDGNTHDFYCLAESESHAKEQAENAYPNETVLWAVNVSVREYPYPL